MKYKRIIFLVSSILFLLLGVTTPINRTQATSNSEQIFLTSPRLIEVSGDTLFIYDDYIDSLFSCSLHDGAVNSKKSIKLTETLVALAPVSSNSLVAITQNSSHEFSLVQFSSALVPTKLSYSLLSFPLDSVIAMTGSGNKIFMLKNDGDIEEFELNGSELNFIRTISKENLSIKDSTITLIDINFDGNNLIVTSASTCYEIVTSSLEVITLYTETTSAEITRISKFGDSTAVLVDDNTLKILNESSSISLELALPNDITSAENALIISDYKTAKVYQIDCSSGIVSDLKINDEVHYHSFNTSDFTYLKIENGEFLLEPYMKPDIVLESSTYITLIGYPEGFEGCYKAIVTIDNINYYYYINLEKNTDFASISLDSISSKYVTLLNTVVYSLPSTNVDEINSIQTNLARGAEVTILSTTSVLNASGEEFYLVSLDSFTGFILKSSLQPLLSTVELTLKCNARTIRKTEIFSDKQGENPLITLEANTRIMLLEEVSPKKEFVEVKFETTSGEIISGFIKASDVNIDGLTTLQILGLVLITANLVILGILIFVKVKSKKWKARQIDTSQDLN